MPGFEAFGQEERGAVEALFNANGGVLFAHGYVKQRNGVYRVRELEKKLTSQLGVKHVQATSTGSAALWCAMRALGVEPGDEVITQAYTFVATVEAILLAGARPVILNIDTSLNLDPAELEAAITPRTKLIVPVHMHGVPARLDEIFAIARKHHVPVLEDAAQAAGGSYRGKPLGTMADAGVYSLDFNKMVTCGEGGLVLTNRDDVFFETRCVHDHGHEYDSSVPRGRDPRHSWGFNCRMTELQAAIAIAQFDKLEQIVAAHRRNKNRLKNALKEADLPIQFRHLPDPEGDNGDTLFFFTRNQNEAAALVDALNKANVGTKNVPDAIDWHFAATWDHMLKPFYDRPLRQVFQKSAELLERTVSVPIWMKSDDDWFNRAVGAIVGCYRKVSK